MKRTTFMSEFNLSDVHGGGLTCRRILVDDLFTFDSYVSLIFEGKDYPWMEEIKDRGMSIASTFPYPDFPTKKNLAYVSFKIKQLLLHGLNIRWGSFKDYEGYAKEVSDSFLSNPNYTTSSYLFVPQGTLCVDIANNLHRKAKVDYVTWIMDDHVLRYKNGKWHYPRGYEKKLQYHLEHARKVITISPVMSAFYKERFGVESEVLFGGASNTYTTAYPSSDRIKLAYFGSLHDWQIESLAELIPYLSQHHISLDIYSYQKDLPDYLTSPAVSHRGAIAGTEVSQRMKEYHAVLLPLSFRDEYRHMVELNIATKMSECIGSGTIPVVFGPSYAAMAKYIGKREVGITISEASDFQKLLLLKEVSFRHEMLSRAKVCLETEVSNEVMQNKWKNIWSKFKQAEF